MLFAFSICFVINDSVKGMFKRRDIEGGRRRGGCWGRRGCSRGGVEGSRCSRLMRRGRRGVCVVEEG